MQIGELIFIIALIAGVLMAATGHRDDVECDYTYRGGGCYSH